MCFFVVFRFAQGLPLLLHIHDVHQGTLGRRAHPGRVRSGIPRAPCGRIRALHTGGHADGELREGAHRLQAEAQRPPRQHRAQVFTPRRRAKPRRPPYSPPPPSTCFQTPNRTHTDCNVKILLHYYTCARHLGSEIEIEWFYYDITAISSRAHRAQTS